MNVRRVTMLAVVFLGSLAAVGWWAGWLGHTADARSADGSPRRSSPRPVSQIPAVIPRGGVRVGGTDVVLTPWAHKPRGAMSSGKAITRALFFADANTMNPVRAVPANFRDVGAVPSTTVPAWVVTFTWATPSDVNQGPPGSGAIYVTHATVAVNAVTGKFLLGFFEP